MTPWQASVTMPPWEAMRSCSVHSETTPFREKIGLGPEVTLCLAQVLGHMPRQKSTHVDDPHEVGRRLKEAREAAGVSQRRLAFPGCSPAYISRIEAGERIPSLQILRELGQRLDVDAEYLARGSSDVESVLVDAEIALRLGELDQAEAAFASTLDDATGKRRARALAGLGEVASRGGDVQRAISYFEEALVASGDDPAGCPEVAESLGRSYASVGRLPEAITIFRRCVSVQRSSADVLQMIRFACLLGYALTDNAEIEEAERVVAEALAHAQDVTDPYTRARLYWSQARLEGERGRVESSSNYARMALEILRMTEDTYAIAHAHQFLAHVYLDADKVEEAEAELEAGRPLIEATATPVELAHFELEEARLLARRGELERARTLAMTLTGKLGGAMPQDAGRAYVLLGEIFEAIGDIERAVEIYELAIEQLEALPTSRYLLTAQRQLAAALERLDRPDLALTALKKAMGMQERLVNPSE